METILVYGVRLQIPPGIEQLIGLAFEAHRTFHAPAQNTPRETIGTIAHG